MAWERRRNQQYFYQARRVDGRVRRQYVGRGHVADIAASMMRMRHLDRDENASRRRQRRVAIQVFREAGNRTVALVVGHLLADCL